jgi:DNA-directed RNA polymerase subunit H (RpoH/RPB5)
MDEYTLLDVLYRSRVTLLKMLEARGYDTKPFSRFGREEIKMMRATGVSEGRALRMDLTKPEPRAGEPNNCIVLYTAQSKKLKQGEQMKTFINENVFGEGKGDLFVPEPLRVKDKENTEIIVILSDEVVSDPFHAFTLKMWRTMKLRIRFFQAATIVNDPSGYAIVPKHRKISKEESEKILHDLYLKETETKQLPIIRFHEDMQARWLGLVENDIVEITRPSPSAGEYIVYRVCLP